MIWNISYVKTVCNNTYDKNNKNKKSNTSVSDIVYHVVTALKQKFGHFFICTSYKDRVWWEFTGNLWIKGDADIGLRKKMTDELFKDYQNVSKKYRRLSDRFQSGHPNKEKYDMISCEIWKVANRFLD